MDPVKIAWRQLATAVAERPDAGPGRCKRCGSVTRVVALDDVVSAKFTGFDQLQSGDGLCAACTWSFASTTRLLTLVITPTKARVLDTPSLYEVLLAPVRDAVVVPFSGRKHVLPSAHWGTVRVDDANLVWTSSDAERLRVVANLRTSGVPPAALHQPTLPWAWARQHLELIGTTQREWETIAPWRNTPYLALALKATQHLKGQP